MWFYLPEQEIPGNAANNLKVNILIYIYAVENLLFYGPVQSWYIAEIAPSDIWS